ncbi:MULTISPECIES: imidazole glycerol phosphate synthase subunit HisH [unclassified Halorhodospira]|uniref:imidazole glycerol phosphate synthase subunit HisH n=1 Tax=unclassified Halorhodospira TaxID=2626748 RepID=UPI001EE909E4|nr:MULTISPECIES: imidazole glycerol phosphate synthase subunit HisH [unclassified Halorhodospira]MCG5540913.1 imidazole glycerol phosphate synthase subunit HisH [Halorhodospira sp. M39old]MCG5546332.1 imidazole glycerol phosphate synthase subunit HisH [Halorhodospira sp. M38]
MSRVAIVDYGMGNLRSVYRALAHAAGDESGLEVTADPARVRDAERVVLPGVGAIGDCMTELDRLGLTAALIEAARSRPFLGICLGMQALLTHSEESGGVDGLGVLPGRAVRFPDGERDGRGRPLKVPHMGWSRVHRPCRHPLWAGIEDGTWFYFVHSYYVVADDPGIIVGQAEHGCRFAAAVADGPCFAVQFHPEKSQDAGLRLYRNFLDWDGSWT